MATANPPSPEKVVCAIDFGTSYSGYAYGSKADLDDIYMNKTWNNREGLSSYKTATSVLVSHQGTFENFGFEAESKYVKLLQQGDTPGSIGLFKNFKMLLHDMKDISTSTQVRSTRCTTKSAIDIFVMAIEYLKHHFMDTYKEKYGTSLTVNGVLWVLTVPAIWSEKSKRFMREAAYKAKLIQEIDSPNLVLALEPEAAALYCQALHTDNFRGNNMIPGGKDTLIFDIGTTYLIVDAGGGTIDVTAQQITTDFKVKELIPASGGSWGGNQVNAQIEKLFKKHFGKDCINQFKVKQPDAWHNMEVEFEKKKRATSPEATSEIVFPIYRNFSKFVKNKLGKDIEDVLNDESSDLIIRGNDMVITETAVCEIFHTNTSKIISHLSEILNDPKLKMLKYIFLVGGFSESDFLFKAISVEFSSKGYTVLSPEHCSTAIMKGAVIFGLNPNKIITRIARKTYGFCIRKKFIDGEHDISRMIDDVNGETYCDNIFRKVVSKGDEIKLGKSHRFITSPFQPDARYITKRLYYTDDLDPKYCDEEGVYKLGEMRLDLPPSSEGKERRIKTEVVFSGTEMKITATDISTGNKVRAEMDFISGPIQRK